MAEIRNLTRNGETFYPLTHEKAVIGMEDFKDTITTQISQYQPIEITGDVTNAPDEEDITSDSNNLLKFKNRNNLYGLGKVILRRGSSFASQVTLQNTIYVIQYNFDLEGARINIPNGSILLFEGGSLSNGTLVCADLYDVRLVYYQDISVIFNSVTLEGNFIYKACDKDTIREILVDNSSITKDVNDVLSVKASGIQNIHLNGSVVDNSSISLDTNNKISIKDGGITGNKLNSGIVNTDDLSIVNNKIQLANRGTTDGMGKIILRKDQSFASQLTQTNTIYVIRYNFTLTGNVTVPENCTLEFDGGSISGAYTITGQNTSIKAGLVKIFNIDITLDGTWSLKGLYPEWFGAKGDGVTDDGAIINAVLAMPYPMVLGLKKTYITSQSLLVYRDIYGNSSTIQIADSSVNMSVIHTQNNGLANPVCIRDLRVFGGDTTRVATGFYIDTHHVTLENCIAHSFNIGILVTKWSIALLNCHSNYNNKNLCMYSYGQGGNLALINDIDVIGGNYSGPAGPYCVTVGDTSFNDSVKTDFQGYRILLQGFCFDGGSIHINRTNTVTLDNLYGENPGNNKNNIYINSAMIGEQASGGADNSVSNIYIKRCYIRGGLNAIQIENQTNNVDISLNNFARINQCVVKSYQPSIIHYKYNNIQFYSGYPQVHCPLHINRDRFDGAVDYGTPSVCKYFSSRGIGGRYLCGQMFTNEYGETTIIGGSIPGYYFYNNDERQEVTTVNRISNNIFELDTTNNDIKKFNAGDVVKTSGDGSMHIVYTCDYDNNRITIYPSIGGSGNVNIYHAAPTIKTIAEAS